MLEYLFNIFILPIFGIIQLVFEYSFKVTISNVFLSILFVSFIVNLLCLPMYNQAEKYQKEERDIQKKLEPKVKSIKKNFKGDEKFMILSTYYRQNNYHPIMALRSSLSLLIQIPFFIAAYMFFSHLAVFNGMPLGIIRDLSKPDGLLNLFGFSINVLPFIMTFINIAAAMVYSKGLPKKELIQLYTIPFVFLVLLYNSASGLVLYWTLNNCFSLIKNIALVSKSPKKSLIKILGIAFGAILVYLIHHIIIFPKSYLKVVMPIINIYIVCGVIGGFSWFFYDKVKKVFDKKPDNRLFLLSVFTLALWIGFFIPTNIISSAPQDFALISENISNPIYLILYSFSQSLGIFVFLGCILYFFTNDIVKNVLNYTVLIIMLPIIFNTLVFTGNLGLLSTDFRIDLRILEIMQTKYVILNSILNLIFCIILPVLYLKNKKKIIINIVCIILIALVSYNIFSCTKIQKVYKDIILSNQNTKMETKEVIHLTSKGKNVIIIFLDRAIGIKAYEFFEKNPDIREKFRGFTFYPNIISFGKYTLTSYQALMGGYEYHPIRMNEDNGLTMLEKHNQSLLVLPLFFKDNGFRTLVVEPAYEDLTFVGNEGKLFKDNDIGYFKFENNLSKYLNTFDKDIQDLYRDLSKAISIEDTKQNLLPFSFVIVSPSAFKYTIYDNTVKRENLSVYDTVFLNEVIKLNLLKNITRIDNNTENSFVVFNNMITHLNKYDKDYTEEHSYANKIALEILDNYFDYLKQNNVFDNSRIIIVSDHGGGQQKNDYMREDCTQFNPLLLVKDFNSKEPLKIDMTFMTNADMPFIATKGFADDLINPLTKQHMKKFINKKDSIVVLDIFKNKVIQENHKIKNYMKEKDRVYLIKDNIFEEDNWIQTTYGEIKEGL